MLRWDKLHVIQCINKCLFNSVECWTVTCGNKTGVLHLSKLKKGKSDPESCSFLFEWTCYSKDLLLCTCSRKVHPVWGPVVLPPSLRGLWRKEVLQEVENEHFLWKQAPAILVWGEIKRRDVPRSGLVQQKHLWVLLWLSQQGVLITKGFNRRVLDCLKVCEQCGWWF